VKHYTSTVAQRRRIGPALWELWLHVPGLGDWRAGQGCLVATPTYLRRAFFPAGMGSQSLVILIAPGALSDDPTSAWLLTRAAGDQIDLTGPFGRGFSPPARGERWLLVAETAADVGPLRQQIQAAVAVGAEVLLLSGALNAASAFPAGELPTEVELRVATADGSLGTRGNVSALLEAAVPWADRIAAMGSQVLYRGLQAALQRLRPTWGHENAQVLIWNVPIVCGVGACRACTLQGPHGVASVCQDGPVFPLDDAVALEAIP
jgi:NAD(P)H-flavin reductase